MESTENGQLDVDYKMNTGETAKRIDYSKKYWWNGMLLDLYIIANCLNVVASTIEKKAEEAGQDIQTYLRTAIPRKVVDGRKNNGRPRKINRPQNDIIAGGLTINGIAEKYGMSRSMVVRRIDNNFKTLAQITSGFLPLD